MSDPCYSVRFGDLPKIAGARQLVVAADVPCLVIVIPIGGEVAMKMIKDSDEERDAIAAEIVDRGFVDAIQTLRHPEDDEDIE
jgi:hypothetical protein